MKSILLSLIAGTAMAASPTPPAEIERNSYLEWTQSVGAPDTPYHDFTFRWYETQLVSALPREVAADPENLFVSVAAPLTEARRVESAGDAEEGTTYGLETYAVIDAPVETVKETILFRWGKPVGKESGETYPNDTVFGFRKESAAPVWGPGSYRTETIKRNGGIAQPMNDVFSLLVRGNAQDGYVLAGTYIEPVKGASTTSTTYITIIMIKPTADGKTDYRVAGFLTGQSYNTFGTEFGRRNYGFNASRIRDGQKDFISQVMSLKNSGRIPERRPK